MPSSALDANGKKRTLPKSKADRLSPIRNARILLTPRPMIARLRARQGFARSGSILAKLQVVACLRAHGCKAPFACRLSNNAEGRASPRDRLGRGQDPRCSSGAQAGRLRSYLWRPEYAFRKEKRPDHVRCT